MKLPRTFDITSELLPVAPFPERRALFGTTTRKRLKRMGLAYCFPWLAGALLSVTASSHGQFAFGLGLIFPGAGMLAHASGDYSTIFLHWLAFLACLSSFGLSLLLWLGTGNVILPVVAWIGFAVYAGLMDHGHISSNALWLVACFPPALGIIGLGAAICIKHAGARERLAANDKLATLSPPYPPADALSASSQEFSFDELRQMRFLLDRALQPVEMFEGFDWIDQFQTASVRYQINLAGYALAAAQWTRLSAFHGYLNEAQQNLIEKLRNHRVWRYWALENLWGNLRYNPDPVGRENVMFTGFAAAQMAFFHAASGTSPFSKKNSFSLRHPSGKSYLHDHQSLVAALENGFRTSEFSLFACEPNWIYPLCNLIAASSIRSYDHHYGTEIWPMLEQKFRSHMEEDFITLSGDIVPCRSALSGLALPAIGGVLPQALPCLFLNTTFPDIAQRQWLHLRDQLMGKGEQGLKLNKRKFWPVDVGNYRFSRAPSYAATAAAAREMGDNDIAALCLSALDNECPATNEAGVFHRQRPSILAHALEFMSVAGGRNVFRSMVETPKSEAGPLLNQVPYPDVLVAKAVAKNGMLNAVLYPSGQGGRYKIGITNLVPHAEYRCVGTAKMSVTADAEGEASLVICLTERLEIWITPLT